MSARRDELKLDDQLCFALYDASRAFTRAYAPLLSELGLTYPQYLVLLVLWEAQTPMLMGDIGDRLHLDSGTLTPLLRRLDQHGLLTRAPDQVDERRVVVSLTATGQELRGAAADIPARILQACGVDPSTGLEVRDRLIGITQALTRAADRRSTRA